MTSEEPACGRRREPGGWSQKLRPKVEPNASVAAFAASQLQAVGASVHCQAGERTAAEQVSTASYAALPPPGARQAAA